MKTSDLINIHNSIRMLSDRVNNLEVGLESLTLKLAEITKYFNDSLKNKQ